MQSSILSINIIDDIINARGVHLFPNVLVLWLTEGNEVLGGMVGAGNKSLNDSQVGFATMHCTLLWQVPVTCPSTW